MFRKVTLALALAAAASLGAMALSSNAASASPMIWPKPHHHHLHWYPGYGIGYFAGGYGCYQQRMVLTPFGYRWRTVNVCVY